MDASRGVRVVVRGPRDGVWRVVGWYVFPRRACFAFTGYVTDLRLGIDDGEGVGETVAIIALAILTTLNQIELENMWAAVPNLSLVLSIYMMWFSTFDDAMDCVEDSSVHDYPAMICAFAEKHGVPVKGVHDVEAYSVEHLDEDQVALVRKAATKDKFKFKQQVGLTPLPIYCCIEADMICSGRSFSNTYHQSYSKAALNTTSPR